MVYSRGFIVLTLVGLLLGACGKEESLTDNRYNLPGGALASWNNDNKALAEDFADREVETQFPTSSSKYASKECAWKQIVVVHDYETVRAAIADGNRTTNTVLKSLIFITEACVAKNK